jgi:hypothetical protein
MGIRAKISVMNKNAPVTQNPVILWPAVAHRKQMLWQVWVPLGSCLTLVLVMVIITVAAAAIGSEQIARWGNISAIWVITPVLLALLLFLAIFSASVYGMAKLLEKMPGWLLTAQTFMVMVSQTVRQGADTTTRPILAVNSFSAQVSYLWNRFILRK